MKKIITYIFLVSSIILVIGCDGTLASVFNANNESNSTDGRQSTTVLTYIVGSDLQCNYNLGALNIKEMQDVGTSANLNIVVQTGGVGSINCQNYSSNFWQGYSDVNRSVEYLGNQKVIQELGSTSIVDMGSEQTLQDFIEWGVSNYKTDRYILVLWDHGGGINGEYGLDTNTSHDISSPKLVKAIKNAHDKTGKKFEIIGFDACLMGMSEFAAGLAPLANYLVASEETEPGAGWNYTTFLQFIQNNPNASGAEIGKVIVDGFIEKCQKTSPLSAATLSVIDLSKVSDLLTAINTFSVDLAKYVQLSVNNWIQIAAIRWSSLDFSSYIVPAISGNGMQYVDLINFMEKIIEQQTSDGVRQSASSVLAAARQAVVYSRNNNVQDAKGLSIYFPSSMQSYVEGNYENNTSISGQTFFVSNYSSSFGLVNKYYQFYLNNQSSLSATVGQGQSLANQITWTANGTIVDSSLFLSNSTGILFSSQDVDVSNKTITFNKAQAGQQFQNWNAINGVPILLFSSPNMTQVTGGIDFIIPVAMKINQDQQNMYLAVRTVSGSNNQVIGVINDTFLTGKVINLEAGMTFYPRYLDTSSNAYVINETQIITVDGSLSLIVEKSSFSSSDYVDLDYVKSGAIGIAGDFVLSSNIVRFR